MPSDPTFNEATEALDRIERDAERAAMREVWNARHPATPSAPTPRSFADALEFLRLCLEEKPDEGSPMYAEAVAEIDRLRSSPGATPPHAPDCDTVLSASDIAAGITSKPCNCGAATHSRDAALGKLVREALATVPDSGVLHIEDLGGGDSSDREWEITVMHEKLWENGDETDEYDMNDATRALASQLRAVTTGETT